MRIPQTLIQFAQNINGITKELPQVSADQARIQSALNVVFAITGAVAVMMVVIGGIKYGASQGDPQAVSKAKGTIIYALVGLVISIFAVAIVDFVFGNVA
jgi:hypothetical protein